MELNFTTNWCEILIGQIQRLILGVNVSPNFVELSNRIDLKSVEIHQGDLPLSFETKNAEIGTASAEKKFQPF